MNYQKNILQTALRVNQQLYGKMARSSSLSKTFSGTLGFFFNLLGFGFGFISTRMLGSRLANALTFFIAFGKAGWQVPRVIPHNEKILRQTQNLVQSFQTRSQRSPFILFISSHPRTVGEESSLLGDLVLQALHISRSMDPKIKFQLVQAIDPFALDTLPWPIGFIYAGFIAAGHIAVDRLPMERLFFQRALFRAFHYRHAIFRILRSLKERKSVFIALPGGVVHNSRIFYTGKEFAQRLFFASSLRPSKREVENEILTQLTQGLNSACVTGRLSMKEREGLNHFLTQLKIDPEQERSLLSAFEKELSLNTPYRVRLFRVLFHRLCGKGMPLLLIPLKHTPQKEILFGNAALVTRFSAKTGQMAWISSQEPMQTQTEHYEVFVKNLVETHIAMG